jgi:hypothetical protein
MCVNLVDRPCQTLAYIYALGHPFPVPSLLRPEYPDTSRRPVLPLLKADQERERARLTIYNHGCQFSPYRSGASQ